MILQLQLRTFLEWVFVLRNEYQTIATFHSRPFYSFFHLGGCNDVEEWNGNRRKVIGLSLTSNFGLRETDEVVENTQNNNTSKRKPNRLSACLSILSWSKPTLIPFIRKWNCIPDSRSNPGITQFNSMHLHYEIAEVNVSWKIKLKRRRLSWSISFLPSCFS